MIPSGEIARLVGCDAPQTTAITTTAAMARAPTESNRPSSSASGHRRGHYVIRPEVEDDRVDDALHRGVGGEVVALAQGLPGVGPGQHVEHRDDVLARCAARRSCSSAAKTRSRSVRGDASCASRRMRASVGENAACRRVARPIARGLRVQT